jgi:hypothetical protein
MRTKIALLLILAAPFLRSQAPAKPSTGAPADEPEDVKALAKETQNPVADLVTVPFQFNFNTDGAYKDQTFFNLNFQPVVPIHLTPKLTYISRTIVPIVSIPTGNGVSYSGIGDIVEQTFFTPAHAGKVIVGIGPSFSFPTATAYPAKTGTWAGGGSAVVLASPGPWVLGSLFVQLSPMYDSGGPPKVNSFLWQYFVNYNFGKGWALTSAPSITADWTIHSGQKWTVPYGAGIARTMVFNRQPINFGFQYYYAPVRPSTAASSTVRLFFNLLFPQRPSGK